MKRLFIFPVIALVALSLAACTGYRTNMEQGQNLTTKQVQSIHHGMSRQAVMNTLGTPVLDNPYNPSHMIYVYTMLPVHGKPFKKQLVLTMAHGRVAAVSSLGY